MSPGEITPLGHLIAVAPAACALQSQATQVILPLASTSTWPPWSTSPGVRMVPVMSFAALPAVTSQVPVESGARFWHIVIFGGVGPVGCELARSGTAASLRPAPPRSGDAG